MSGLEKPRLAIVGVGAYFRMLSPGIAKEFETVVTIDRNDYDSREGSLRKLIASYQPEAVMVLTPNRFHAEHIEEALGVGVPVFVEKPLVTSQSDLDCVLHAVQKNPALYCSDFYVDVWDAPLLKWLGQKIPACLEPWVEVSDSRRALWSAGRYALGEILSVEATLLEGIGPASSFVGREWLWDADHGGVLWDMGYHDLALWFRIIGEPVEISSVERRTISGAPENASETYGAVEMVSASGIKFSLKVGKYIETGDDRAFKIIGTNGTVSMDFTFPSQLTWNGEISMPLAVLQGAELEYASAAFREYVESKPPHPYGLDIAEQCVKTMLSIRERGL